MKKLNTIYSKQTYKHYFMSVFCLFLISNSIAQCPSDIYGFGTQAQVDNFVNIYPNCEDAYVFVFAGNDISDLSPLSYIDRIGHIQITDADNITSLMAFDNTEIFFSLNIDDSDGLLNLDGIHLSDYQEYSWLFLTNNSLLNNIDALDDLDLWIESIRILDNPNLSQCSVSRVCNSLLNNDSTIVIGNNGSGCNSLEEIEIGCNNAGINDINLKNEIVLFPNPTSNYFVITISADIILKEVVLYDLYGRRITTTSKNNLDLSHLSNGVYFIKIYTNNGSITKKILKH